MTKQTTTPTPAALQAHAHDLARAFDVRLIVSDLLQPEEGRGMLLDRGRSPVVLVAPVSDETTYAVQLHEIGHFASATGTVRLHATGDVRNLMRIEEDAAWQWARHYALIWTPIMEAVAQWAEGTYALASAPPPTAPADTPVTHIDWGRYRK